jgi:thiosulfate reductase cytochrome b subunit
MPKKIVYKHPLAIRWMHWINFPVLTIMIWSGMLIYWANDVYELKIFNHSLIKFFPEGFYKFFHIPHRLAEGMAFHFAFMWIFFINGLLYVSYTLVSGEWKYLLPQKNSFKESWQVLLYDFGLRKQTPPQLKYNAAQRIAYSMIIAMGLVSILTGLAIYKPFRFNWITALCGGYEFARILHFVLTIGYVLFFLIHVFQVIKTGWNNFRAMIAGFEIIKEKDTNANQ